ncbi:MAG: hypothetical protein PVG19_01685 [Desulfobacterales bacterium]|jgi:hypothetical protein
MVLKHTACIISRTLLIAAIIVALANTAVASDESAAPSETAYRISETELQSGVMSFADRLSAILLTAFERYDKRKPSAQTRNQVLSIVVYSLWNAYIIASESDPDIALLDMVSMVTLGRIIFEEQGIKTFGPDVRPIADGFRKAEEDIRGIAVLTLDPAQIDHLMALIRRWRKANPEVTHFPFVRFSNFSADRRESKLTRGEDPDGLIDSVEAAAQEAEDLRLLAERGLYLGTRMPQLASLFAELWSARLADDVATERRRAIAQLSDAIKAERQATIDNFMADVATERRKAIAHMEDVLTSERQATIEEFMAQQKLIVTDALQQMNQTAETLVERILRQITILIALFLVGLTLANLLVGYILRRKSQNHQPAA